MAQPWRCHHQRLSSAGPEGPQDEGVLAPPRGPGPRAEPRAPRGDSRERRWVPVGERAAHPATRGAPAPHRPGLGGGGVRAGSRAGTRAASGPRHPAPPGAPAHPRVPTALWWGRRLCQETPGCHGNGTFRSPARLQPGLRLRGRRRAAPPGPPATGEGAGAAAGGGGHGCPSPLPPMTRLPEPWAPCHAGPWPGGSRFLSSGALVWRCAEGGQTPIPSVSGRGPDLQDFSPSSSFLLILGAPVHTWPLDRSAGAWWQPGTSPWGFSSRCLPCPAMPRRCCGSPTTKTHLLPARKGTEGSLAPPTLQMSPNIPCHAPRLGCC